MSFAKKMKRKQDKKLGIVQAKSEKVRRLVNQRTAQTEVQRYVAEIKVKGEAIREFLLIFLAAVRAEYGFGHEKLGRLDDKIFSHFDCIKAKLVTVDDIKMMLNDEAKFSIDDSEAIKHAKGNRLLEIRQAVMQELSACFCIALMDGFGFKEKRLYRAYTAAGNIGRALRNHEATLDDVARTLIAAKFLDENGKRVA